MRAKEPHMKKVGVAHHGHTAVLKLGVAEPHDGLVGDGIGDAKRVPDLVASLLSHTLAAQAQCRQPGERTVTWRRCVRVLILPDSELTGCALRAALSPCARPGRQQLRAHRVDERHLRDSHTGSASDRHNGGVDEGRGHERGDHHRHDQICAAEGGKAERRPRDRGEGRSLPAVAPLDEVGWDGCR
eukprot:scaffold185212_cov26-Tisochrysis_lutea.AAC.1